MSILQVDVVPKKLWEGSVQLQKKLHFHLPVIVLVGVSECTDNGNVFFLLNIIAQWHSAVPAHSLTFFLPCSAFSL